MRVSLSVSNRLPSTVVDRSMRIGLPRPCTLICAALIFTLVGCAAIQPARMELPPGMEAGTERAELTGLGGGTSGSFRLAGYSGTFTRGESRLGIFDPLLVFNRASAGFVVAGPGLGAPVAADCKMRQTSVTVGLVTVDPKKMHYGCDFRADGMPVGAYFAIAEADDTLAERIVRTDRRGEMLLGRTRLEIRSTSRLAGSSWPSETPIGYLLDLDGHTVAAIELNGTVPTLFLPIDAEPEVHRAVLLASLALAVFWDPANSMLGE